MMHNADIFEVFKRLGDTLKASGKKLKVESNVKKQRTCNRHNDCDKADKNAREHGDYAASHCHDECCEECFGY